MLQDEDKDILSKEGFQDALVQNEIKAQFEMISLLKEKKSLNIRYASKGEVIDNKE